VTKEKRLKKAKKHAASGNTFASVSAAWLKSEAKRAKWTPAYLDEVQASLSNHLSKLDPLPLAEITAAIAAPYLRKVEKNAPDMAKKVRQRLRSIFDYAVEDGVVAGSPIPAPRRRKRGEERGHFPVVLSKDGVGKILRAADKGEVGKGVQRAHLLAVFTAQRIGEIVGASWDEVDLQSAVWSIPRDRTKRKDKERGPHLVPISPRLLALMREWRRVDGADALYVCPARGGGEGPIVRIKRTPGFVLVSCSQLAANDFGGLQFAATMKVRRVVGTSRSLENGMAIWPRTRSGRFGPPLCKSRWHAPH
jgi:integrase